MIASFLLTWRALVRGHVAGLLGLALAVIHLFFPALARGDGTAAGHHEMVLRVVFGSVVATVLLTVLLCACGLLAQERERRLLPLAAVRPVPAFVALTGRWLALCALAALSLAVSAAVTYCQADLRPDCRLHIEPVLPPPAVAAAQALDEYLKHPDTPEEVRRAPRAAVLKLLTTKELDRYDVIPAGGRLAWRFDGAAGATSAVVRVCFASTYSLRQPVRGKFEWGGVQTVVSNATQAVVEIPLTMTDAEGGELIFVNEGQDSVMLRPRRDLALLLPADGFGANLVRATVWSFAGLAFAAAFGLFLSAGISRPVAVFSGLILLAVACLSPQVARVYPDQLSVPLGDRIGLALARGAGAVTDFLTAPSPVSDLATGKCIRGGDVLCSVIFTGFLFPMVWMALAACLVRKRPLGDTVQ